jgi:RimJ/RimL family protein N-acetyltransferase
MFSLTVESAIQAETHPDNVASQRVLEKAGFTLEGHIRKS